MHRIAALIIAVTVLAVSVPDAFSVETKEKPAVRPPGVELAVLIGTLAWEPYEALKGFPIIWKTIGVTRKDPNPLLRPPLFIDDYGTLGEVVVSVRGKYLRDAKGRLLKWHIARDWKHGKGSAGLVGIGPAKGAAELFGDLLAAPGEENGLKVEDLLAGAGIQAKVIKCEDYRAAGGFRIYEIEKQGSKRWLLYKWAGSKEGATLDFLVISAKATVDDIECGK